MSRSHRRWRYLSWLFLALAAVSGTVGYTLSLSNQEVQVTEKIEGFSALYGDNLSEPISVHYRDTQVITLLICALVFFGLFLICFVKGRSHRRRHGP